LFESSPLDENGEELCKAHQAEYLLEVRIQKILYWTVGVVDGPGAGEDDEDPVPVLRQLGVVRVVEVDPRLHYCVNILLENIWDRVVPHGGGDDDDVDRVQRLRRLQHRVEPITVFLRSRPVEQSQFREGVFDAVLY